MQCPKCGFEVSDQAIFCTNCGTQLKNVCPECGGGIQVGASFCSQCGLHFTTEINPDISDRSTKDITFIHSSSSVQSQVDPYERRIVTILFADIAGYTRISEVLDPEELAEIMGGAYPSILEPILENKGSIVQVMGDGVLAYFGAPLSREDDPERAVMAGLEIVERVQAYSKKLQQEKILDEFQIRVGINTGLVVVGELNPEKHLDYIALGDAVNLAARLQQNAPKDGVLISHTTYQQTRGLFDVQPHELLNIKGREKEEKAYLVKQRKPFHKRLMKRGLDGVATTMIGREPEMAALKNIYYDAIQGGETALVLIRGDPGIGKTRLVNEFTSWVKSLQRVPFLLRGRAITGIQDTPYGVLRYMFARRFGILETDSSAIALEKFRKGTQAVIDREQSDFIGQLLGFDFKIRPFVSETAELYLKNYLLQLAEKSLLIIVEDLHWMDDRSLDFISEIVTEFGGMDELHMMILCTARTQFFEDRPKWGEGISGFVEMSLRRLSRLQSRSLVDEILFDAKAIPEKFYQCVVEESGGNPFFIEEMIKMFIDEGVVATKDDTYAIKIEKLEDLRVPSTLKGILQARLDSLPVCERQLLQRAAVIGRTFWDGVLRVLIEDNLELHRIKSRLKRLRERGLIFHREHSSIAGHQEFIFKHALLRDEAYETVLLKHRRKYHKRVAIWIEENSGDRLEEHLSLIADHYLKAGEEDLAADWFIRAGVRALKLSSMHQAKNLFEKAIKLISEKDTDRLWKATLGHDEVVGILGDLDARHADDEVLLTLARSLEDDRRLAEVHYRIGTQAYLEGKNQQALHAFNKGLDFAKKTDDLMMQALILPMKITILVFEGELQQAGSLVEDTLTLARQTKDADILARALFNVGPYFQAMGDLIKSIKLTKEMIEIYMQQGNRLGETYGLINLGYYYLLLGQFTKARRPLERAVKISTRLGAKSCLAYGLLNLGLAYWRLGESQEAFKVLESSSDALKVLGDQRGLASKQFYLGLCFESANNLNEAVNHFKSAIETHKLFGAAAGVVEAQAGLARLALNEGDLAHAKALAQEVIEYLDDEGSQSLELPILAYLSCVKVFEAVEDSAMAQHVIIRGKSEIQDRLDKISDDEWKRIFLQAVPENRELLANQKEA